MSERTHCYVYDEISGGVLFQLPRLSRRMDEGDTFTVDANGDVTTYKGESVNYKLTQIVVNSESPQNVWAASSVGYGVSIVP